MKIVVHIDENSYEHGRTVFDKIRIALGQSRNEGLICSYNCYIDSESVRETNVR